MTDHPTPAPRKQLTLSPEALAVLRLPLFADDNAICNADGTIIAAINTPLPATYDHDCECAHFIAALLNAALTAPDPDAERVQLDCNICGQTLVGTMAWCKAHECKPAPTLTPEELEAALLLDATEGRR